MGKYRHELKFSISSKQAAILKKRLAMIMNIDANSYNSDHTYLIRSLYFDDINSTAYYEKLDGVEYRKKYRIRIYNNDDRFIRLEKKLKNNDLTSKQQTLIDKRIYQLLINKEFDKIDSRGNKLLETFIIDCKIKGLIPSVIVEYKRLAYTYPICDVRITFDEEVKSGIYNYDLFDENLPLYSVINPDTVILEVKFNEVLPESLAIILGTIPSCRQAVSKFAICRSVK